MLPLCMQDPWIFIRKTLENAFDARDMETVRIMSDMLDRATVELNRAAHSDCPAEQTG